MATRVAPGTKVRVAYPAKSDSRSETFSVFFGGEVEGIVLADVDEFSAYVQAVPVGEYARDDDEPLQQFVAWDYLTPAED